MVANITLDEKAFRTLVFGGVVQDTGANGRLVVEIILADIGFATMRKAIDDASFTRSRPRPLEDFTTRGRKAQAAVDTAVAIANLRKWADDPESDLFEHDRALIRGMADFFEGIAAGRGAVAGRS